LAAIQESNRKAELDARRRWQEECENKRKLSHLQKPNDAAMKEYQEQKEVMDMKKALANKEGKKKHKLAVQAWHENAGEFVFQLQEMKLRKSQADKELLRVNEFAEVLLKQGQGKMSSRITVDILSQAINAAYGWEDKPEVWNRIPNRPIKGTELRRRREAGNVSLYDPHRATCHSCQVGTEWTQKDITAFWGGASFVKKRGRLPERSKRASILTTANLNRPQSARASLENSGNSLQSVPSDNKNKSRPQSAVGPKTSITTRPSSAVGTRIPIWDRPRSAVGFRTEVAIAARRHVLIEKKAQIIFEPLDPFY